jgi:hypothetical protein
MTAWQARGRGESGGRRRGAGGVPGGGGMAVGRHGGGCSEQLAAPCSLLLPLLAGREKKVTWGRKEIEERGKEEKKRKWKNRKIVKPEILGEKNKR